MAKKLIVAILSIIIVLSCVSGTIAFLVDKTESVVNEFIPTVVDVEVEEEFDGENKENIKVKNIGTASAYVRIRLVSVWYNSNNQTVAKDSWFSDTGLELGDNWFKSGDYYYYKNPVLATELTETALFKGPIKLTTDASDNTHQVLIVLAEAIQADYDGTGTHPATDAWGVTVNNGTIS